MKLALCLFKYFPFGGMQRNFRAIALEALRRGHAVRVYTGAWEGPPVDGIELVTVPLRGRTTQSRQRHYARFVHAHLGAHPVERVVGFNRMPGLDVYYGADSCEAARLDGAIGAVKRLLPRYRHLLAFERAVFAAEPPPRLMFVAERQRTQCLRHYPAAARAPSTLLPPGIARQDVDALAATRAATRAALGIADHQLLLLAVGSGFRTKGLARTLRALAALPAPLGARARLFVAGDDRADAFLRLARQLGIADSVHFLGGRDDVPQLLAAADLLLHPALFEAGGAVLLEAAVAGLPVLASAACGFAPWIERHDFGRVIPEPFAQPEYQRLLRGMLEADAAQRARWSANGRQLARSGDIYDRAPRALDFIEQGGPR